MNAAEIPIELVPSTAVRLFRMSWQLELWLREIVHVELRAAFPDWEDRVKKHLRTWPPRSLDNDKRLHHMSTSHQAALSYLTLGELWTVISADENWPLFEPYLPPRQNVLARIDEVKTIRNRVAHSRRPHPNDAQRLELFIRDIDPLIRKFCCRYTSGFCSDPSEPVANALRDSWEQYGYATELFSHDVGWIYAPGFHRMNPRLHARLGLLKHPSRFTGSEDGAIYRLDVLTTGAPAIDLDDAIQGALRWQSDVIHITVPSDNTLSVTIPHHLGPAKVLEVVADLLQVALNATSPSSNSLAKVLQREWPEGVLLPSHPLAGFTDDYEGPMFDLD